MSKLLRVTIRYGPEFYYRRIHFYSNHIKYMESVIQKLLKDQKVLVGGTTFPQEKGIWYLKDVETDEIESILKEDPFNKAGLIEEWQIEEVQQFGRTSVDGLASLYEYSCL